jgi:EpsI family protein
LLGATLGFSHGVEFREKVPISQPFELFPLQVGEWTGTRELMEKRFVDSLDLSDYVIVNYRNPSGRQINLYVAFYESQRKGESIYIPGTCGWLFRKAVRLDVDMGDQSLGGFPVNRALMQKMEQTQLVYYWFPQRGRILTNAYELKFYAFWDALTRQRTDGALVRLITPVYEGEEDKQAEDGEQRSEVRGRRSEVGRQGKMIDRDDLDEWMIGWSGCWDDKCRISDE